MTAYQIAYAQLFNSVQQRDGVYFKPYPIGIDSEIPTCQPSSADSYVPVQGLEADSNIGEVVLVHPDGTRSPFPYRDDLDEDDTEYTILHETTSMFAKIIGDQQENGLPDQDIFEDVREIPIEGSKTPATCGAADYDYLSQFTWFKDPNGVYRKILVGGHALRIYMHHEIIIRHRDLPQFDGFTSDYPTAAEQVAWAINQGLAADSSYGTTS